AARLVSWDETLNVAKASCLFEDRVTASVRTLAARCETREQLQLLAGEISLLVQTRCKDDFAIHGLTLESIELQIGEETYRPKFKKGDQVRLRPSVSLERPNPLIEDRRAYCEDDLDKVWTILGFNFQVPAGYSVDEGKNILESDLELVRSERCSALPDEESSAAPISD
ncbi:MAG: hypothetical protein ABIG71_03820, partial [Candidatus Uhrbacteria bacterium]